MTTAIDNQTLAGTDAGAPAPDPDTMGGFLFQLLSWYTSSATTCLVDIGSRAGFFDALAAGPATSEELADRAGLSERHVREWLGGVTVAGIVSYDSTSASYTLPIEHAVCLTGDSSANLAPFAQSLNFMASFIPSAVRTFDEGGGIPYDQYRPEFTELQDSINRRGYDDALVSGYVPAVEGLGDRLQAGVSVADIGCGSGHVVNLLARAFPASTFVGFDLGADAIEAARVEADAYGLTNARFEVLDVSMLPSDARFDAVMAFDAIHDQARPRQVLAEVHRVLADDGLFVMVDMNLSSNLEDNIENPIAPWIYTVSLLHCMQVSLAEGGEGLGAAWGRQKALELLAEAGFTDTAIVAAPPQDPVNTIFVARP